MMWMRVKWKVVMVRMSRAELSEPGKMAGTRISRFFQWPAPLHRSPSQQIRHEVGEGSAGGAPQWIRQRQQLA